MILHFLKNDLRNLRLWLLAWAGLLGGMLSMMTVLRTPLGWSQGYWEFLRYGFMLGFLIQMLFQALLIFKVVQKENLQNAQSYWLTRPIGRGHLVTAKLLFWLLLILLPQLVQCALIGGIFPGGWEGALRGAEGMLLVVSLLGFFSILAASVTKDVGQALLVVFIVPVALLFVGALFVRVVGRVLPVERMVYSLGAVPYLEVILIIVSVLFGLFAYWRQMHDPAKRWRHRLASSAVLLLFLFASNLPTVDSMPKSTMSPPEGAELELSQFMFTRTDRPFPGSRSQRVERSIQLWRDKASGSDCGLKVHTIWNGLPETWVAHAEPVRSYDAEGRWLREPKEQWHQFDGERMFYADYLRSLFPDAEVTREVAYGGTGKQLFSSPLLRVNSLEPPLEFTTVFATRFYRPELTRLPMDAEAKINLVDTRVRLLTIEREGDDMILEFSFLGVGQPESRLGWTLQGGYFVLRDPISKRVALGRFGRRGASNAFGILSTGRFEVRFEGMGTVMREMARLEFYHLQQNLVGTSVEPVRYTVPADN